MLAAGVFATQQVRKLVFLFAALMVALSALTFAAGSAEALPADNPWYPCIVDGKPMWCKDV